LPSLDPQRLHSAELVTTGQLFDIVLWKPPHIFSAGDAIELCAASAATCVPPHLETRQMVGAELGRALQVYGALSALFERRGPAMELTEDEDREDALSSAPPPLFPTSAAPPAHA